MNKDSFNLIYKYTDVFGAKKILESNSILLRSPDQFNDPYDCEFTFTDENSKASIELVQEYCYLIAIRDLIKKHGSSIKKRQQSSISLARNALKTHKINIMKTHMFESNPTLWNDAKEQIKKIGGYNIKIEKACIDYESQLRDILQNVRKNGYIGCFSKRYDSILMWAHYADKFKGVCIEWSILESKNSNHFFDIVYSKEKPQIDLYKLMKIYLGYSFIGKHIDGRNPEIQKELRSLIITKGIDWSYEKEIRFIETKSNENHESFSILRDGEALLYMVTQPKRVFLGERISKKDEQDIREICSKYADCQIIKTKHSKTEFSIEIDNVDD